MIRGNSITGANYYRVLGTIEPGQCSIIEDEGDSISEDPDKVRILKSGYEYNTKIPKTKQIPRIRNKIGFMFFVIK